MKLAFRIFTTLIATLAVLFSAHRVIRWTTPGVVYVSCKSGLLADGTSATRAFPTIQQALDRAMPGDTIRILDGVYNERLHLRHGGTNQRPLILEAANPGKVLVTWESPLSDAVSGGWHDEGDGIFSALTTWPIYRIHRDEQSLYRVVYGGLPQLQKLVRRETAWDSFCYESGRVYVWLSGGTMNGLTFLKTHRRAPEPREWGEFRAANLTIESSNVQIRGMRFEFGIGSSVMVMDADNVEISECSFFGATYGLSTPSGNSAGQHVSLQKCLYHNYPQHSWRTNWLSWDEIYVGYASSSLISANADFVTVKDCVATHFGDAVQVSNTGLSRSPHAELIGNFFALGTDDAFEIEGPARNIDVLENLVYECHESLGLSPVELGPVTVTANVFLHRKNGTNGAQVKLINRDGQDGVIQNIKIQNNLFVGNWLCWMAGKSRDVHITGNSFVVFHQADPPWPNGVIETDNWYFDRAQLEIPENVASEESDSEIATAIQAAIHNNSSFKASLAIVFHVSGPGWWNWPEHLATRDVSTEIDHIRREVAR